MAPVMLLALFLYVYVGLRNFDPENDFGSIATKLMERRSARSVVNYDQVESLPHTQGFEPKVLTAEAIGNTAINSSLTNIALLLAQATNKKPDSFKDNKIFLARDIVEQIDNNTTLASNTARNLNHVRKVTPDNMSLPTRIITPLRLFRDNKLRVKYRASARTVLECPLLPLVCKFVRLGTASVNECDKFKNCAANEFCCSAPCVHKYYKFSIL